MSKTTKTVYGSEKCFKCKQLVKELTAKGEKFEYVDISTLTPNELEIITDMGKSTSLPIVCDVIDVDK